MILLLTTVLQYLNYLCIICVLYYQVIIIKLILMFLLEVMYTILHIIFVKKNLLHGSLHWCFGFPYIFDLLQLFFWQVILLFINLYHIFIKMSSSDFEWGVKNGDLEKVKEAVEKVCTQILYLHRDRKICILYDLLHS